MTRSSFSSPLRRVALLAALCLLLSTFSLGSAFAQSRQTHYVDVAAGAWYEDAAAALLQSGALDANESRLRPNDLATRAEMVKLLVELNDLSHSPPARSSFDDIHPTAWYSSYFEAAARVGWVRGDRNCYGTHPCTGRPADNLNRAEAAALLVRAFALPSTGAAPVFSDNTSTGQWYFTPIQTAADNCVLMGDDQTRRVRPASLMNRAEMVAMFHRASQNLDYGVHCGDGTVSGDITSATVVSARTLRLHFNTAIQSTTADDAFRYTVSRAGQEIDVLQARVIDSRTVELTLESNLTADLTYTVTAANIRVAGGGTFTDSVSVRMDDEDPGIMDVSVSSSTMLRVRFTQDIDRTRGDDTFRYTVTHAGGGTVGVDSVTIIDDRTVDLRLNTALQSNATYILSVNDLLTEGNVEFDDSMSFVSGSLTVPDITDAMATSSTRVRLTFNVSLTESIAEERTRYRVTGQNGDVPITEATLIGSSTVELTLGDDLESQQQYTVSATNLRTQDGQTFSDTRTLLYGTTNVSFTSSLSGLQEVPPVVTTAAGTGSFTLTSTGLQYDITLRNMSGSAITGAHFHLGSPGVNGGVLEPINFNGGLRATGTWTNLTPEERDYLLGEEVYVNVHTNAYPDGEIRGQVER